jgi:hypothetical protein
LAARNAEAIATVTTWGPIGIGDQRAALKWVAESRQPGELVINQTPALVYLDLGDIPEARFLNRYDEPNEYARYTRFTPDGKPVDYWLGQAAIGTMPDLCQALADHPGSFLVMAQISYGPQFQSGWYGEMIQMIDAASKEVLTADGVVVLRSNPPQQWEKLAVRTCRSYGVDIREERRKVEPSTRTETTLPVTMASPSRRQDDVM